MLGGIGSPFVRSISKGMTREWSAVTHAGNPRRLLYSQPTSKAADPDVITMATADSRAIISAADSRSRAEGVER